MHYIVSEISDLKLLKDVFQPALEHVKSWSNYEII